MTENDSSEIANSSNSNGSDFGVPEEISISSPIEFPDDIPASLLNSPCDNFAAASFLDPVDSAPMNAKQPESQVCFGEASNNNNDSKPEKDNDDNSKDKDAVNETSFNEDDVEDDAESDSAKRRDIACWFCHLECIDFGCSLCPRGFHLVCMENGTAGGSRDWICPICEVSHACYDS